MSGSLAPGLLVAAPSLKCPFFHHTVVLLVHHDEEGSFGFVVNKAADVSFDAIVHELQLETGPGKDAGGEHAAGATEPEPAREPPLILYGGPVKPETGWILFDPRGIDPMAQSLDVAAEVSVTASLGMLQELAVGRGPARRVMLLGYSGWSPGQLDAELQQGSWIPVDVSSELVFEAPIEARWRLALEALGIDPGRIVDGLIASA